MNINGIFIFIATCVICFSTPYSRSAHAHDVQRNNDGSCTANKDCFNAARCENNKCVYACQFALCGENARCTAKYHEAICTCEYGWIGDPLTKCTRKSCTAHNDCYHSEKCEDGACVPVCELSSCGSHSTCRVENHSSVCTCEKGYTEDPYGTIGCVRETNCTSSNDCDYPKKCIGNVCIDLCESVSCGENAFCITQNHVAECSCRYGFIGDPLTGCVEHRCTTNGNCWEEKKCENSKCIDACSHDLCGVNAFCNAKDHVAVCHCYTDHTGDPYTECVRLSCNTNDDCYDIEKCEGNQCISLCESDLCGNNAHCAVKDHVANCTCIHESIGDPFDECVLKDCTDSNDCPNSEKCQSNKCINPCDNFYETGISCNVKDHIAVYSCEETYSGDIYTGCVRSNCTTNNDCYSHERCESSKCIDA